MCVNACERVFSLRAVCRAVCRLWRVPETRVYRKRMLTLEGG